MTCPFVIIVNLFLNFTCKGTWNVPTNTEYIALPS